MTVGSIYITTLDYILLSSSESISIIIYSLYLYSLMTSYFLRDKCVMLQTTVVS